MKTIEQPFGKSIYARMDDACIKYELECKKLEDLKFVREQVAKGQLKSELYDFINMDGSMEALLPGLPRPDTGIACESLRVSQLAVIDATIAEEELKVKNLLQAAWMTIKAWLTEWLERDRWERKHLIQLSGLYRQYASTYFGDESSFGATTVHAFRRSDWYAMMEAAHKLNDIHKEIPKDVKDIEDWIEMAKPRMSDPLSKFGKYIDENNHIRQGQPEFIKQTDVCANLRWRFSEVEVYLQDALRLIGDEISVRQDFNKLDRLFTMGGEISRNNLMFLREAIFNSKETTLAVSRMLKILLHRIIKEHNRVYRVNGDPNKHPGAPRV